MKRELLRGSECARRHRFAPGRSASRACRQINGDGLLIEFPTAADAVACSLEIQKVIAEREADFTDDLK